MIARVLKACDIEEKAKSFKPYQMKYFEGCVEAPLQICLQAFILIAGQMPGINALRKTINFFIMYHFPTIMKILIE